MCAYRFVSMRPGMYEVIALVTAHYVVPVFLSKRIRVKVHYGSEFELFGFEVQLTGAMDNVALRELARLSVLDGRGGAKGTIGTRRQDSKLQEKSELRFFRFCSFSFNSISVLFFSY